ncbi:protease [Actinorhabdospora filicis]|uniref:microbial collagenase n=1 Tax=Actinorhabdospora filicis TaxID=1785913 RepID=A0A9W6SM70_9ACTN|nr:M9 family metallopeptidase [Actinorhabdospora filicis]GLZ77141.1 protease [Actinorhabdospora filicis]
MSFASSMIKRSSLLGGLVPVLALSAGLLSAPAYADPAEPAPAAAPVTAGESDHVQKGRTDLGERAPFPASTAELRRDYDDPNSAAAEPARPSAATGRSLAAASCTPGDFAGRSGSALVTFIKASTTSCINTLFNLTGTNANGAFREAQMVTVANALASNASAYPGDNSTATEQLVLYLRAGYYVQWYYPSDVGTYGASLKSAIQTALDRFFADADSSKVTDANGEILSETVTLIDSAQENARYIYVVKRLLTAYNASYDQYWWMVNAVNNVYTVLFRGHQVPAFVTAVQSDTSLLSTLRQFAADHVSLLGGDNAFLTSNAGRELGRFLQHTALQATARPLVKDLLGRSSITGTTAPLWVGVAEMTDSYDKSNCSYYGTCDLANRLSAAALPISYTCSASIKIRAQQMTSGELAWACNSLTGQDAYFHSVVRDAGPVANDRNTTIEVNVFDSSADYQTYAGAIFGIDTNNGGMYLEGDPSVAGNQPRFIAYEAEWLRPEFAIWNLNHEYTHYLDGRFDMFGDFGAGMTTPTVWWVEGFAEYISYSYRNMTYDAAITEAAKKTYTLSTLFDTTYDNSDSTRIYRWGYLAVRFMLQSHRADMDKVLGYYRAGQWSTARTYLTSTVGTRYNAEFSTWLGACGAGNCGGGGTTPTLPECTGSDTRALDKECARSNIAVGAGDQKYFYIYLPAGVSSLEITSTGGTGECDLYYNANSWATASSYTQKSAGAGTTEKITVTSPASGYRYISLVGGTGGCSGVSVGTKY